MGSLYKDLDMDQMEADFGEGQVIVFYKKMNLGQMDRISKKASEGQVASVVESLLVRAFDEEGRRLFKDADRVKITSQFDADEVFRVVQVMNEAEKPAGN